MLLDDPALIDQEHLKRPGTGLAQRRHPLVLRAGGDHQLLGGRAFGAEDAAGPLAAAHGGLAARGELGDLLHGAVGALALHQLVDERRSRASRARHELGAHTVGVHGGRPQCRDGVLIEVVGDGDSRRGRPHGVELGAHLEGLSHQVAGVQAHRPELTARGTGRLDGPLHAGGDVIGVHQDRGARSEAGHLRREGLLLGVVQEGEGVGRGPHGGNAVEESRLQVARSYETADDRGPGRGDGCLLVGPARPEVHAGAPVGGDGHAGGGCGDGAVVVVDRQGQGLQDAGLGEGALHGQQRGAGEVALALGVAADRPGEAVVAQEVQGLVVDDPGAVQEVDLGGGEREGLDGVQQPTSARHHTEAA